MIEQSYMINSQERNRVIRYEEYLTEVLLDGLITTDNDVLKRDHHLQLVPWVRRMAVLSNEY